MAEPSVPFVIEQVVDRVRAVRKQIDAITQQESVRMVAVTKGYGDEAIRAALAAGLHDVGENYAQELLARSDIVPGEHADQFQWHFLGRLQRNKVKKLASKVDVWQSVDSHDLIDLIAKCQSQARVFIQVDLAGQSGRGGCSWDQVADLVDDGRRQGLFVEGLMGVGVPGDPELSRRPFRRLAILADELGLKNVSAGMSADYEVAVEEGATMIRLGTALFGERPGRRS